VTDAFILAAKRTPIGRFLGSLKSVPASELGARPARSLVSQPEFSKAFFDEVIFGSARQAGNGPNLARQIGHGAGLSHSIPAFTVNQACASSLKALVLAAQSIRSGEAGLVLAGGVESMSRVPFLLDRVRSGYRLGDGGVIDAMFRDGFLCPLSGQLMGETAETLAQRYSISREEQDEYAAQSQRRCERARKAGRFQEEIVPWVSPAVTLSEDETPREGVTVESLSKLPPAFRPDGTVHAGNSCALADSAVALALGSGEAGSRLGLKPLARVAGYAAAGVEPELMGLGPVPAVRALEKKLGWPLASYDLVELNEAFAAQVIACDRELRFDRERLNVNGGAIALGHPVGATGARLVVTLLHEMKRRGARRGLAALCVSGGLGLAVAFEAV
jgi:acetyl-CoA C-acetyltransferase